MLQIGKSAGGVQRVRCPTIQPTKTPIIPPPKNPLTAVKHPTPRYCHPRPCVCSSSEPGGGAVINTQPIVARQRRCPHFAEVHSPRARAHTEGERRPP